MALSVVLIIVGLALLVWSADRFVEGAAAVANFAGMSPLLIGMLIVGFGTSAPEMAVSAISAWHGNPNIALGNGYGSNITNIALILGITAIISPIAVHSQVLRKELPILSAVTLFAAWQIYDNEFTQLDAWLLLAVFGMIMGWTIIQGMHKDSDSFEKEMESELQAHAMTLGRALFWVAVGLILLVVSSQMLVSGAVTIAQSLGISDLIIGLTIVAIGTSLPELASSVIAAKKGEHDIALGNIIGSNLFNTTAVVGIAGAIHPMTIPEDILIRDWPVMAALTASLFVLGYSYNGGGRINRIEGGLLLSAYIGYTCYLIFSVTTI
ncbi:MAG: calcium/sodium antiporter [Gammaproteobacteria bacterium]|uniref:calcium/sodium antiporter n=1 Tax=Methylotuvimicrobium sp. TaxID=2822413 RepID=UPI001D4A18C0|nr:calcium/sodium antiporter [Gammaproteobacteria bacterium]